MFNSGTFHCLLFNRIESHIYFPFAPFPSNWTNLLHQSNRINTIDSMHDIFSVIKSTIKIKSIQSKYSNQPGIFMDNTNSTYFHFWRYIDFPHSSPSQPPHLFTKISNDKGRNVPKIYSTSLCWRTLLDYIPMGKIV